jgi:hypothetical protein
LIFIILVLIIAAIFTGLNMYDNSNIEKIRVYLSNKNCTPTFYAYGTYKGVCPNELMMVKNSFSLNIEKNQIRVPYETVVNLKQENLNIIVDVNNDEKNVVLKFKEKQNQITFYEKLQEKREYARNN